MVINRYGESPKQPVKTQTHCQRCAISRYCLPVALTDSDVARLDSIVKHNRLLHKGDYLFRAGECMQHVYAVRSGCLKSYLLSTEGVEQITGFYFPGELLSLDAFGAALHRSYAVALETSLVCAIYFGQLEELCGNISLLRKHLLTRLSQQIHAEQALLCHQRESAEQRLAAFLLNLSLRYSRRGFSAVRFNLPMTRGEIASYLGLSIETVSRLFSRYRNSGLIEINGREVILNDAQALSRIGETCVTPGQSDTLISAAHATFRHPPSSV